MFNCMTAKKILLSVSLFSSTLLFSQADCIKPIIYSGKINIKNFQIDKIYLPSTRSLGGYRKFKDIGGSKMTEPVSGNFKLQTATHLSSDFCGNSKEIIADFFKKAQFYPVKVSGKKINHTGKFKILKFKIPVEKMSFTVADDDSIEIIFPDIIH